MDMAWRLAWKVLGVFLGILGRFLGGSWGLLWRSWGACGDLREVFWGVRGSFRTLLSEEDSLEVRISKHVEQHSEITNFKIWLRV